jgi:hypothetical protein
VGRLDRIEAPKNPPGQDILTFAQTIFPEFWNSTRESMPAITGEIDLATTIR